MRNDSAVRHVVGAALALAALAWAHSAPARPFDPTGMDWEGCADFVRLATDVVGPRATLTSKLALDELTPADAVILIHPDTDLDMASLDAFLKAGGRLALFDDFGKGDGLLRRYGIERVPLPSEPAATLRHNPELAIADPIPGHPIVNGVDRVVLNHATGVFEPKLSPLLEVRGVAEPDVVVALAGEVAAGRIVVVGDASVLINAMLRYPGNLAFARNVVNYVAPAPGPGEPAPGQGERVRTGRVYILVGAFTQRGTFAGAEHSEFARGVKDALSSIRESGMPPWMLFVLAAGIGLGVVLWVGTYAGKLHHPQRPRYTRGWPLFAQGGLAGHAALLGEVRAARGLALLELKKALEEELAMRVGLDRVPAADILVKHVARTHLLDAEGLSALRALMLRMANVETLLMSKRAEGMRAVRGSEVVVTAREVQDLLARARAADPAAAAHQVPPDAGGGAAA